MVLLKNKIKNLLPKKIKYIYYLCTAVKASMYDLKRRVRDKVYNDSNEEKVKRDLTLAYHIVEKGLTMPEVRLGFGRAVVLSLITTVEKYIKLKLDTNEMEFVQSVSVLKEYLEYHRLLKYRLDTHLEEKLENLRKEFNELNGLKQIKISKHDFFSAKKDDFNLFCRSRYSVRNYIDKEIPLSLLYNCIELAQRSPSFCNRQPTRVHIVKSKNQKKEILNIQNGNRGFGHLAECLLLITSVVSTTKDIHERFENHLNGGLFSMTLLNALHYNEIGACSLNWSVSNEKDIKLREIVDLPDNEVLLMIIACGYLPEEFSIASSPRKTAEEISFIH